MTPVGPQIEPPTTVEWAFVTLLFLLAFLAPFILRMVMG